MSAGVTIPPMMKAAAISRFGPPSLIRLRERAVPTPGPDEVLIRVDTAGVGSWDPSLRDGTWRRPGRTKFPLVLGTEGAGVIVARGSQAKRLPIGTRVYAYESGNPKGGFYAEYAAVKASHVARIPRRLNLLEAGAAAPIALTALQGVVDKLRLRRGQTILIFGGSGAVGTLAIQFAKQRGARVLATASGRRAERLVRRLGADAAINARRKTAADQLRKLAPDGLDAVLAFAGGEELERFLDLVRAGGCLAFPNGIEPAPRPRKSIRRVSYDVSATPQQFKQLERAIAKTPIRVPIAAVYPLAKAATAHQRLAKGHVLGSIVLRVAVSTRQP